MRASAGASAGRGHRSHSLEVSMLDNAPEDIRRTIHNLEEGDVIDSVTAATAPPLTSSSVLRLASCSRVST